MQTLPIDAMVTIFLYLIGAPALLIQNTESEVRYVLRHNLRSDTYLLTYAPVAFGFILIMIAIIYDRISNSIYLPETTPELIISGLLVLAIFVSVVVLPISRKRNVVMLLRRKMNKQIRKVGRFQEYDMYALMLLGTESEPGEERFWTIQALNLITKEIIAREDYGGARLDRVIDTLQKVIVSGEKIGSPENFVSAVGVLRPIIQTYYQKSKQDPWFSDADLYNAYLLLSEMGQRAMDFPIDGIASTCLEALDGPGIPNPAASQRLSEIGIAGINKNRIGPAREALHILDYMVSNSGPWCEAEEVMFDYLGLLASFWGHTFAGRKEALQYLQDLEKLEVEQPDRPELLEEVLEGEKPDTRLDILVKQAISHHSIVGRFTIADNIADMWQGYNRDYRA